MASYERFWWGEIVEFSHDDVEEMIHQIELGRDFVSVLSAFVGTLPGGQLPAIGSAGIAQIVSNIDIRSLKKKDKGNGVVIKRIYYPVVGKFQSQLAERVEGVPILKSLMKPVSITLEIQSR
jgi:hypothetical protein